MKIMQWMFFLIIGSANIKDIQASNSTIYKHYQLVRFVPTDEQTFKVIKAFKDPTSRTYTLKRAVAVNDSLDLLVSPNRRSFVKDYAKRNGLQYVVLSDDYSQNIEAERYGETARSGDFDIFKYHSADSIQAYLKSLAKKHPKRVTLKSSDTTIEGRPLTVVTLSKDTQSKNKIIMIDAGTHAREWVSISMALYLIHRLVEDKAVEYMLDGVDWLILPLVNPDGYEHSRTSDRMWRKNRSTNKDTKCTGVDLNRNFDSKWGTADGSTDPCDYETYRGKKPFSEKESSFVRDTMKSYQGRIKLYISLHTYGNCLLYPWGYAADELPDNWKYLDRLAKWVSDKIVSAGGPKLKVMSASNLYVASGSNCDYAMGKASIPFAYTFEMTNNHEFIFPQGYLKKSLIKYFKGFDVFYKHVAKS